MDKLLEIPKHLADNVVLIEEERLQYHHEKILSGELLQMHLNTLTELTDFALENTITNKDHVINEDGEICTASLLRWLLFSWRGVFPWTRADITIPGLTAEQKAINAKLVRTYYDKLSNDALMERLLEITEVDHIAPFVAFSSVYKFKADKRYHLVNKWYEPCMEKMDWVKALPPEKQNFVVMGLGRLGQGVTTKEKVQECTRRLADTYISFECLMIDKDPGQERIYPEGESSKYKSFHMSRYCRTMFDAKDILDIAPYNFEIYTHLRFINMAVISSGMYAAVADEELPLWDRVMALYIPLFFWNRKRFGGHRPDDYFRAVINKDAIKTFDTMKKETSKLIVEHLQTINGYKEINQLISDIKDIDKLDYALECIKSEVNREENRNIVLSNKTMLLHNLMYLDSQELSDIIYNSKLLN